MVGGPPVPAMSRREWHGQRIGPLRQLWVSSLGGDDRVNDALLVLYTHRPKGSGRICDQR